MRALVLLVATATLVACEEPQGICRITCPGAEAGTETTETLNYETPSSCDDALAAENEGREADARCTSQFQAY